MFKKSILSDFVCLSFHHGIEFGIKFQAILVVLVPPTKVWKTVCSVQSVASDLQIGQVEYGISQWRLFQVYSRPSVPSLSSPLWGLHCSLVSEENRTLALQFRIVQDTLWIWPGDKFNIAINIITIKWIWFLQLWRKENIRLLNGWKKSPGFI